MSRDTKNEQRPDGKIETFNICPEYDHDDQTDELTTGNETGSQTKAAPPRENKHRPK